MKALALFCGAALTAAPLYAELPRAPELLKFQGLDQVSGVMLAPGGSLFASDPARRTVGQFTSAGMAVSSFSGVQDSRVPVPGGLDSMASGDLVLAQKDPCLVAVYRPDGSLRFTAGAKPSPDTMAGDPTTCEYLHQPSDAAVGPDGRIYVADTGHHRVAVFSGVDGSFLGAWGSHGYAGEARFSFPMGIAVSGGRVYVADAGNARVMVYDLEGAFVRQIGGRGIGPEGFDSPFDVAVDGAGRLWVADNGLQKVVVFDKEAAFLKAYGLPGDGAYFEDPQSLYAATNGDVLLGDGYSGDVFVFRTGVSFAREAIAPKGPEGVPAAGGLAQTRLAFGPVPVRAGHPLLLQLPFNADQIHWELLSLDMRRAGQGESRHSAVATAETAGLASGVYFLRTKVRVGSQSRLETQKVIVTR